MTSGTPQHHSGGMPAPICAVFFVSCGILGYEVSLMRVLLVASWHHFAFLVMSVALLGFGASGTALSLWRSFLVGRSRSVMLWLSLATAVSFPIATGIAQHIPVEARFVPALLAKNVAWWMLYWAVLFVPFFLGASVIGLALIAAHDRLPAVYASNLAGSALGACIAPFAMRGIDPAWLAVVMGAITLSGAASLGTSRGRALVVPVALTVLAAGAFLTWSPPRVRTDTFKYDRYVRDLIKDGRAKLEARTVGPRAVVEVYSGDAFHELAFLSGREAPPPMLALVMDGHWAGSVLRVRDAEEAAVVDHTMMSAPYALAPPEPSVLLLGETGGANIWLALRRGARRIDVVQPNPELLGLLRHELREKGGLVFDEPGVNVVLREPRHHVDHARAQYDVIHIAALETWAVASGGVAGLQQDNLVTVEGLRACLKRLTARGVLFACRAIETPPRDNAKLIATISAALRSSGVARPETHIAVVRDFLAVCTMVKASPWTSSDVEALRRLCAERELTPVYFTGIRHDELNRPDELPGPPGERGDWIHHAALALFSDDAGTFIDEWPFDIRPPTDDRPFFENFGKLESIGFLRRTFGELWLTRTELAFLFVVAATGIVAAAGALLTILPLFLRREIRGARARAPTALYFAAIGLGYMMIEIAFLSRLVHLIGDPVIAGAVTIGAFLFFSGAGSLVAQRVDPSRAALARRLVLALAAGGVVTLSAAPFVTELAGPFALYWRLCAAVAFIGPLAFLMGFPMPMGLRRLDGAAPALVPWAWGVNGFASVLAPPLATAVGMAVGFRVAGAAALVLYALAAVLYGTLPLSTMETPWEKKSSASSS